jgi:copper chaperone
MNYVFDVPDVSCGHCKMRIEQALGQHPEVSSCRVDIDEKLSVIESGLSPETLIGLLDEAGYDAVLKKEASA